jgi:DNA-binding MarR family transcriptional regulator
VKENCTVFLHICVEPYILNQEQFSSDVNEFASAIGFLVRKMRRASSSNELSVTQRVVIARLSRDGAMTTSDLARAEGMKPQSMGATVANLEELGLVERQPHPTDGRQMNVLLTIKGVEVQEEVHTARQTWLIEAISELTDAERRTLFDATAIIKNLGDR